MTIGRDSESGFSSARGVLLDPTCLTRAQQWKDCRWKLLGTPCFDNNSPPTQLPARDYTPDGSLRVHLFNSTLGLLLDPWDEGLSITNARSSSNNTSAQKSAARSYTASEALGEGTSSSTPGPSFDPNALRGYTKHCKYVPEPISKPLRNGP